MGALLLLYILFYVRLGRCLPQAGGSLADATSYIPHMTAHNLTVDDQSGLFSFSGSWMFIPSSATNPDMPIEQLVSTILDLEDSYNGTYSVSPAGSAILRFSNSESLNIYVNCILIPNVNFSVILGSEDASYMSTTQPNATCAEILDVGAGVDQALTLTVSPGSGGDGSVILDSIIFSSSGNMSFPDAPIPPPIFSTASPLPSSTPAAAAVFSPDPSAAPLANISHSGVSGGTIAWSIITLIVFLSLIATAVWGCRLGRRDAKRRLQRQSQSHDVENKPSPALPTDSVTTLVDVSYLRREAVMLGM
ncbi:hypothetical protein SISNIDRAFT_490375 [Sistotremastrum niveocremeum HHB9708]|uniref:Mid2 domain-containing protein n=2 Tax=Sistotremastraceae TaxID=3402574 RepID=A0A164NZC6_9AGAM|nr:hypothetical protein SISNIDRAFT_490375 [Sistotremastrum niveocremeum HHB9708]KZT36521.1 hypothetical protein SISSUDRAFT_1063602 [Sistotremastrum suecicum HHB10207 ss-3]